MDEEKTEPFYEQRAKVRSKPAEQDVEAERGMPSANTEHYKPLESPRMYPLELDSRLCINLWSEDGTHKWTIAMWVDDKDCSELRFVHDRPFDPRVSWRHLEAIARQGQVLADKRWNEQHST